MNKYGFLLALCVVFSCSEDEYVAIDADLDIQLEEKLLFLSEGKDLSFFILPDSDDFSNIPQDPLNPITREKVVLGQLLFHETATGGIPKIDEMKGTYSCASCHQAKAGFSSGLRQGIGECGIGFGFKGEGRKRNMDVDRDSIDVQPIRSPTVLNVAYQDVMLWNGQFGATGTNVGTEGNWENIPENLLGLQGVEVQALKGQKVHRLLIDAAFVQNYQYKSLFDAAFPTVFQGDRYTKKNAALAIAAYERTLLANQSPWQAWLKGNKNAMSDREKQGAIVFFDKGKCYQCHTGPALNDKGFYAFGMGDFDNSEEASILSDVDFEFVKKGRGGFTKNSEDNYKFKTPTLYNTTDNGFYGHGGTFKTVTEVIRYKMNGKPQNTEVPVENLAPQFGAIDLTEEEIENLALFIENSLQDPNLDRYVPQKIMSGLCFPNNDEPARADQGCN